MSFALVQLEPLKILSEYGEVPPSIQWPNGDVTFAVSVGEERVGCRLVNVSYPPQPNEFYYKTGEQTLVLNGNDLSISQAWVPEDLATVKAIVSQRIDASAELERAKYLTLGSGQVMTYQEKLNEARICKNDPAPSPDNYPLLAATIGTDGADVSSVADTVLKSYAQWIQIGAKIEKTRRTAKASVSSAVSVDDAVKVFNEVSW